MWFADWNQINYYLVHTISQETLSDQQIKKFPKIDVHLINSYLNWYVSLKKDIWQTLMIKISSESLYQQFICILQGLYFYYSILLLSTYTYMTKE